jgi:hypothetical protein
VHDAWPPMRNCWAVCCVTPCCDTTDDYFSVLEAVESWEKQH